MTPVDAGWIVVIGAALAILISAALLVRGMLLGYPAAMLPKGAVLTAKEQAIVAACADALFPHGGPIPLSGTEAGLVLYMDNNLRRLPTSTRALVRLLFVFIEHGPWILGLRRRFTRQTQEQRIDTLATMAVSRLYFSRVAFLSMRTLLSMGYLANSAVAEQIGMTPRPSPFDLRDSSAEVAA
jgi:hypothetical protein